MKILKVVVDKTNLESKRYICMKNKNRSETKNVTYRQRAFNRTALFRGPRKKNYRKNKKSIIPNIEDIQKLI